MPYLLKRRKSKKETKLEQLSRPNHLAVARTQDLLLAMKVHDDMAGFPAVLNNRSFDTDGTRFTCHYTLAIRAGIQGDDATMPAERSGLLCV